MLLAVENCRTLCKVTAVPVSWPRSNAGTALAVGRGFLRLRWNRWDLAAPAWSGHHHPPSKLWPPTVSVHRDQPPFPPPGMFLAEFTPSQTLQKYTGAGVPAWFPNAFFKHAHSTPGFTHGAFRTNLSCIEMVLNFPRAFCLVWSNRCFLSYCSDWFDGSVQV